MLHLYHRLQLTRSARRLSKHLSQHQHLLQDQLRAAGSVTDQHQPSGTTKTQQRANGISSPSGHTGPTGTAAARMHRAGPSGHMPTAPSTSAAGGVGGSSRIPVKQLQKLLPPLTDSPVVVAPAWPPVKSQAKLHTTVATAHTRQPQASAAAAGDVHAGVRDEVVSEMQHDHRQSAAAAAGKAAAPAGPSDKPSRKHLLATSGSEVRQWLQSQATRNHWADADPAARKQADALDRYVLYCRLCHEKTSCTNFKVFVPLACMC